ncbi:hypothetical protein KIW84_056615 [Lathyrus oleraceus]|uniref:Retrovirus-related Pol polyprotein from transposon TNT 1-94-like beta-barrel domain-containing protein n=1 Tax=Pisum sativum TaxID=3888 RepID=A0A9D4X3Q6_PEA|nr:hypothetical protein KIW84_056615 [Pisum sativum]
MKQKFQGSNLVKREQLQALQKDFEILHMKEGENVNAYFSRTLTIASKMKARGERHYQYECPDWEKKANYAEFEEKDEEEILLMYYVEIKHGEKEEVWFLDSGCSNHMSGNKRWLLDLDEGFRHTVKLGNDSRMTIIGKGNVHMQVNRFTQGVEGNEEGVRSGNEEGCNNDNEEGGNNDDTINSIESNSSSSESHEVESPNMVEGRVQRAPSYLVDYEIGEGLSDEDNLNAMMMPTEDDPLSFEEARNNNKY